MSSCQCQYVIPNRRLGRRKRDNFITYHALWYQQKVMNSFRRAVSFTY